MSISLKTQNHRSKSIQFFDAPVCDDWSRKLFACCVLFIVCVSIYDTYYMSDPCTGLLHFDDLGSKVSSKFYSAMWSLLLHLSVIGAMIVGGVYAKRKWN